LNTTKNCNDRRRRKNTFPGLRIYSTDTVGRAANYCLFFGPHRLPKRRCGARCTKDATGRSLADTSPGG